MKFDTKVSLGLTFLAYLVFLSGAKSLSSATVRPADVPGSVVLPATMQTALYLGDRYLAANIESTRVLMTGGPVTGIAQDYYERLHLVVTELNPCHEDNYYIANGLLGWGGNVNAGLEVLQAATRCRFWDEVPPFFLGVSLSFFKRDHLKAKDALFEAASRSTSNRVAFQRLGLMFEAESYPDVHLAQRFLISQHDQARDGKLRQLLEMRIGRLGGLIVLLDAQKDYERRFGHTLNNPNDLLTRGVLKKFPTDPVGLGYVFENGQFALREVKIRGLEELRK